MGIVACGDIQNELMGARVGGGSFRLVWDIVLKRPEDDLVAVHGFHKFRLVVLRSITYFNFMAIGQVLVEKLHGEGTGQRAI